MSKEEEIKSILESISEIENIDDSLKRKIDGLFDAMGVSKDFMTNPNKNLIPSNVYSVILALAKSYPIIKCNDDGSIIIRVRNAKVNYYLENNPVGNIMFSVKNGDIFIDFYHEEASKDSALLEHFETSVGQYSDGTKAIRTMEGRYTLGKEKNSTRYSGEGVYKFKEYYADGIQMGLIGVVMNNSPSNVEISEGYLIAQDMVLRTDGLTDNRKISANMQKNMPPLVEDSPFISYVYNYYRDESEIDKLYVSEKKGKGSTKGGFDFALGREHGTDSIVRNGVGVVNMLTEEEFQKARSNFYTQGDIEEEKRKSPLSSSKIDEAYERFVSSSKSM